MQMANLRERVLAEDGPERKRLVIRLTEYEQHRLLDLRYWYIHKPSGEFRPSNKGVMLTRSNYLTVKNVIERFHEEVMDWLGVGYVPEHVAKYEKAQEKAAEETKYLPSSVTSSNEHRPNDPLFFEVEHTGGNDLTIFNTAHPFNEELETIAKDTPQGTELVHLISEMLVAYAKAKRGLEEAAATHPSVLFDQLEYDWAHFLKNLIAKHK